jgi:hypothetical protein
MESIALHSEHMARREERRCNIRFRRNDYVMSAELLYFVKITFKYLKF